MKINQTVSFLLIFIILSCLAGCLRNKVNKFENATLEDIPKLIDVIGTNDVVIGRLIHPRPHYDELQNAYEALTDLVINDPAALDIVLAELDREDEEERKYAYRALREIIFKVAWNAEDLNKVMDRVIEGIETEDNAELRVIALECLHEQLTAFVLTYQNALPPFEDQRVKFFDVIKIGLDDEDSAVRQEAVSVLFALSDRTNRAIMSTMRLDDTSQYDDFTNEIALFSAGLLMDDDPDVSATSAWVLSDLLIQIDDFIPDLIEALESDLALTRVRCAVILSEQGIEAEKAVPVLAAELGNTDWAGYRNTISEMASEALGNYGLLAADAIPELLEGMKLDDNGGRRAASNNIVIIGEPIDEIMRVLMDYLEDDDPIVRGEGAYCLGRLGASAEGALEKLEELTEDEVRDVRGEARTAIQRIETALASPEETDDVAE